MLKVHMNPAVVQILPWLSFSVPGVLNLAVLTINTGVALYCYFCCMFFDPGRVPEGWSADEETSGAVLQEVKKKVWCWSGRHRVLQWWQVVGCSKTAA
eukprot:jgi/Chrzof1/5139/Cz15g13010.t1